MSIRLAKLFCWSVDSTMSAHGMGVRAGRELGFGCLEGRTALIQVGHHHFGDRHAEALAAGPRSAEHQVEHAGHQQRYAEHEDQGEGASERAGHVFGEQCRIFSSVISFAEDRKTQGVL